MLDGHLFVHMNGVIKSFHAYSIPKTLEDYFNLPLHEAATTMLCHLDGIGQVMSGTDT